MEATETPEVLHDLRKKRLAYFETSVKQSSQEDPQINGSSDTNYIVSAGQLHKKEAKLQWNEKDEDTAGSKYINPENIKSKYAKENIISYADVDNKMQHNEDRKKISDDLDIYGKAQPNSETITKVHNTQEEMKPAVKTSSFYFNVEEPGKSSNVQDYSKLSTPNPLQHKSHETEKDLARTNAYVSEVKSAKHVHYDDGYNETVERLIRATKEELLGNKVEDNIWSDFRKQQNSFHGPEKDLKVQNGNTHLKKDPGTVFQGNAVYNSQEPRRHSTQEYAAQFNQNSGNLDEIFHSKPTESSINTQMTNVPMKGSKETINCKLEMSQDLSELGLSTHRPDSGKVEENLTIESHGVKLNESLTKQLRYALGEEKFKEFIEKSKKDIDVLQQERYSARSETGSKVQKYVQKEKESKDSFRTEDKSSLLKEEKNKNISTTSEDFTPRNDGDAVHDMIGEHVLKKKEPRQKLTSNPAYKTKNLEKSDKTDSSITDNIPKKKVPELNLTEVNESPRPMLNRPKHGPHNIYQDRSNKQTGKKSEIKGEVPEDSAGMTGKNYEQVTVSRNIVFSADEIYFQAYGKYPNNYTEPAGISVNPRGTHVNPAGMQMSNQGIPVTPQGIPMSNHVVQVTPKEVSMVPHGIQVAPHEIPMTPHEIPVTPHGIPITPHEIQMTPHGIPLTPHGIQNNGLMGTQSVPMSPHYHSGFNPASIGLTSVSSTSIHSSVAMQHSAPVSQNYYNVPFTPQYMNTQIGSPAEHRGLMTYMPAASQQNVMVSENVPVPRPPTNPPPSYPQSQQLSASTMGIGTSMPPRFAAPGMISEHLATQIRHPPAQDLKGFSVQQGMPHPGYPFAYYPYPVMVMAPHPPAEPSTPSQVQEKAAVKDTFAVTDKVDEETTFTSVSQLPPQEEEMKVPHPPQTKKEAQKRSPRKLSIPENAAKRHIDGIRHHHEQRRQQQEDERFSDTQIIEKQRKFAKASIERYFQSLENLYKTSQKPDTDVIPGVSSDSSDENEYQPFEGKLTEIPEKDGVGDEFMDNEKLNEIFKTTNPSNFDIFKIDKESTSKEADYRHTTQTDQNLIENKRERINHAGLTSSGLKYNPVIAMLSEPSEQVNIIENTQDKTSETNLKTTNSKCDTDLVTVSKPDFQNTLSENIKDKIDVNLNLKSTNFKHDIDLTAVNKPIVQSNILEKKPEKAVDINSISLDSKHGDVTVENKPDLQSNLMDKTVERVGDTCSNNLSNFKHDVLVSSVNKPDMTQENIVYTNQKDERKSDVQSNLMVMTQEKVTDTNSVSSNFKHDIVVKSLNKPALQSGFLKNTQDSMTDTNLISSDLKDTVTSAGKTALQGTLVKMVEENVVCTSLKSTDSKHDVTVVSKLDNQGNLMDKTQEKVVDTKVTDLKHEVGDIRKPDLQRSLIEKTQEKVVDTKVTDLKNKVTDVRKADFQRSLIENTQEKVIDTNIKPSDLKHNVVTALIKPDLQSDLQEKAKEKVGKNIKPSNLKHDIVSTTATELSEQGNDSDLDGETLVNTVVTGVSIEAGGLTERLNKLGIDSTHLKREKDSSETGVYNETKQKEVKEKKGKLLIICPECEGFNKEYMSWCTHCGEMIIGVEPLLVSKNRQGKIRTKPITANSEPNGNNKLLKSDNPKIDKCNEISTKTEIPTNNDECFEKPLTLDLGLMKSSKDANETKLNVSPNKSDGKDSGRPSSDDLDILQNINNRIEQEVEDDICKTITDPVVKGYVKSHFAKRRQAVLEHKSLPYDENMKSKVQSWIDEVRVNENKTIAQTLELQNAQPQQTFKDQNQSLLSDKVNKTKTNAQNIALNGDSMHLENFPFSHNIDENTLHKKEKDNVHFEKCSSPSTKDLSFDHNELALKLTTESMDFSQFGSIDLSHVESVNAHVRNEEVQDKNKITAKQERRRKRGHGAIDVEIFGYEESRECKNSSRGQRLVPILNLPDGSSDEEDMSVQSETFASKVHTLDIQPLPEENSAVTNDDAVKHSLAESAWQSVDRVEEDVLYHSADRGEEKQDKSPVSALLRPEECTDDWQLLFDPLLANDDQPEETCRQEEEEEFTDRDRQPFLMQLISHKGGKPKRPKSSKGKPVKSKVRQSIEAPSYQRKWARSSTAWSSYNPGELKTSSSLRASTEVPGQSSDRDVTVSRGNMSERSVSPMRPAGNKARPTSADVYKRKHQKQRPVSAGFKKSRDRGHGNKDKNDEKMYNLVEHRLPRKGIQEMLQDRVHSPRSTYDKYLEMTPRINEGTLSCWQCLPDEILIHIFAYLSQSDLTRCALVCHQFYRVAMDESLWKYITIKKKTNLDDSCLVEISMRHPISLALIHCHGDQITAKGLRDMFRECADSLKELNISRCSRGALNGDSILLHAAARCHNLTHVDTSWCNVTDSGLMAISNCCHRLESLCINGCQAVSNDGLETVIKKHGQNLRVLEMFGCFNITPRGLQAVSNNCISLTSLHLGQCYKLTDSSIAQLSSSLGRVETLDLRGCKQIKDNCIRRVVKNCTRLKTLSLANCPNITDVSILEIATYLTDIRSVDLCGCKNITDNSIRALVNTCTNLRHIDISSTSCTHRSVSMIANFCAQRLESLRINFLSDVTEASLIKLAKHCKRLTSVHLYGCSSVRNLDKIKEERPTFTIEM